MNRRSWYVLLALLAAVLVGGGIAYAAASRQAPPPDLTVVAASTNTMLDGQAQARMERYLRPMVRDLNGDGKTAVEVRGLFTRGSESIVFPANGAVIGLELDSGPDTQRLRRYIEDGSYDLFLVTDEPYLDFPGGKALCCKEAYCRMLPEDLQMPDNPYCTELAGIAMLREQNLGSTPFYGCIQKDVTQEEYDLCVEILRQLKAA